MAYTKYSLTPANNNAAPPDGAPEGMLPSAVNDTMRDMMAQIRDVGDGIRGGTYTMTAPVITGGSVTGATINNTPIGASTASTGAFTNLSASANSVISVTDNSNAALRITQLGTGNVLLIEDATNPDSSPFVVNASGKVIQGYTSAITGAGGVSSDNQIVGTSATASRQGFVYSSTTTAASFNEMAKSASPTTGTQAIVASGETLGVVRFSGSDGTNFIRSAEIGGFVDGTPSTNDMPGRLVFSTTADGASSPTERMRIDSAGSIGLGGAASAGIRTHDLRTITGASTAYGYYSQQTIQPDVTANAIGFRSRFSTASNSGTPYTITSVDSFYASINTPDADSTVTNVRGFHATNTLTVGVNNYGFYGNIGAGTGRYNLYMNGTADNYMAGNVGIGTLPTSAKLQVAGSTILSNVDMLNASYDSVSFSVAAEETNPQDIFFSPDGTRMFVMGATGDDVNQYSLSTPWVVSSASYVTTSSVAPQETTPTGLFFRADGKKMYMVGVQNDTVYQYSLSEPWRVSTITYDGVSFSVTSQEANPTGIFFKPDGLTMYVTGSTSDNVNQYTLSTAWNVSTATFTQLFDTSGQETSPQGISFTGDGTRMFVLGASGDDVNIYNLTTPWDISTATSIGAFSVVSQDSIPNGIYIKPDGSKFYVCGSTNDTVYQYTIPSIDIQLTGTTAINGSATVAQDLVVDGALTASNVYSGTYTPTLTNVTNVAASTASACQYMRVGNVVTVSGQVQIDPTTTSIVTELRMSLPIASNFTAAGQLAGTAAYSATTTASCFPINGDITNDTAFFFGIPADASNRFYFFSFTYRIL